MILKFNRVCLFLKEKYKAKNITFKVSLEKIQKSFLDRVNITRSNFAIRNFNSPNRFMGS